MEELRQRILYLRDVTKLSFYQIADQTGISRKKASKIYRGEYRGNGSNRGSSLDKHRSLIASWFVEYPCLKACQVYEWLKERGVAISYPSVALYTKSFRKKKEKVYHQLNFLPGEEAQVDWFFVHHKTLGKLAGFILVLSYSRYLLAHLFPRHSFEFFIEGHLMAFKALKGTSHTLLYDNLKSVVLKLKPEVQHNPRFLEFCRHYGIQIRLCNPGRGNEKGRVERAIRALRGTFFNTANYSSMKTMNQGLHEWVEKKNQAMHRSTRQKPIDLLKEEKLKALPAIQWKNVSIHPPVKTTKTAMIAFDTNAYSVPDYLAGKSLSVHSTPAWVRIYDGDKRVACHPRDFRKHKQITNPLHRSYSHLSAKAKMQRVYEVIKGLDPSVAEFLLKNQSCGEDPQQTAYQIFKLLKKESRTIIVGIVRECLQRKSPRLKTFLSYLNLEPAENAEKVQPQKSELLNISYQPRSLEVYDDETKKS